MGTHFTIADRAAIASRIDMLIALLDADDAPMEDLEPETDACIAGDDGCGLVLLGGLPAWGSREDDTRYLAAPRYALNQSLGPVNYREAHREACK